MPPLMQWTDALDVGVEQMNDGHRQILDAMNRIYDARAAGRSGAPVNVLVQDLARVCVAHFADEEAHMDRIGYPGLATHKQLHAQLLARVNAFAAEIEAAGGKPADAFFDFLRFWLTSHIKGIDMKYSAHANAA